LKFNHCLAILFCLPLLCLGEEARTPSPQTKMLAVPDLTYFVQREDTGGCGSAFLLEDTNGVWLVSNVHVFSGSTNLTIINIEGNTLRVPPQVEVAKDRDIIRFRTDQPKGLPLSPSCEYDEIIYAYGDSGGAGVLTKLKGKAVALGPDRIEISADIIPGNSGGPVVNTDGKVVGVASSLLRHNLPDWIADGTRFADTRRMAIRLNDIEWEPVDFSEFYRQTFALKKMEDFLRLAIYAAVVLSDDITNTLIISTDNQKFQSWLKKHNRYATKKSERSLKLNIRKMARMLQGMEDDPTPGCEITIQFLKDKLADINDACAAVRKQAEILEE
jgi:hypothetical protein